MVLLMHGLAGCHLSPYLVRISSKLFDRGMRTFRLDLRGCGAGQRLARLPYNAGRSGDVSAALQHLIRLCPESSIGLVGFSLSGNIALKMLGESEAQLPPQLARAMAVNPSIALEACVRGLQRGVNRIYDWHFTRLLHRSVMQRLEFFPDAMMSSLNFQPPIIVTYLI